MQIVELTKGLREEWNQVALNSNDAWFTHLYDWIEIEEKVWNQKSYSFLIKSNDPQILGIFPLLFQKRKILKLFNLKLKLFISSGMGWGGPAIAPNVGQKQRKKVLDAMFGYIDQLAEEEDVDWFHIFPPSLAPANLPPLKQNVNPLIFHGFEDTSTQTYLLPLNRSVDELWANLDKKCRNAIRKAEKEKIEITKAQDFSDIEDYYKIHVETYNRTDVKPHPFEYFKRIWEYFGTKGIANFFFAEYKGERVAALNVGAFKTGCIYSTSCSKTDYMHLRPNNLLQWHAIKWAKEQGYQWYECGEAFPNTRNKKLKGLTSFKKSFGGDIYPLYKGLKVYKPYKRIFFEFAENIRDEYKDRTKG